MEALVERLDICDVLDYYAEKRKLFFDRFHRDNFIHDTYPEELKTTNGTIFIFICTHLSQEGIKKEFSIRSIKPSFGTYKSFGRLMAEWTLEIEFLDSMALYLSTSKMILNSNENYDDNDKSYYKHCLPLCLIMQHLYPRCIQFNFSIKRLIVHSSKKYIQSIVRRTKEKEEEKYMKDNGLIRVNGKLTKPQKTYIMIDDLTNFYKIGKSVDPRYREHTLLSSRPTIRLLAINDNCIENELHSKFRKKRVRGEWFALSESDIKRITNSKGWRNLQ